MYFILAYIQHNDDVPLKRIVQADVTVLWNQSVHTDREVTANRPDIIIKNKKEKLETCEVGDEHWFKRRTRKNRPLKRNNKNIIIIIIILTYSMVQSPS